MLQKIRIGSRKSKLALMQADVVKNSILSISDEFEIEIVKIETSGDKFKSIPLYDIGGKGLFIKELEEALLLDKIDIAVHSLKDIPGIIDDTKFEIAGYIKRNLMYDVFISNSQDDIYSIKSGSVVGTCSMRRKGFLKKLRPDLDVVTIRGNVDTRIAKMERGEVDALVLSASALSMLEIKNYKIYTFNVIEMVPAVGQGTIAVEILSKRNDLLNIISKITDEKTKICALAERTFLKAFEADCRTPIGCMVKIINETLEEDQYSFELHAAYAFEDGTIISYQEIGQDPVKLANNAVLKIKNDISEYASD